MIKDFIIGFRKGIKEFGHNFSIIVNVVLLSIVYVLGVGLTWILAKIFKKNFLETKLSEKSTYWDDLNLKKKPKEEYYRQF